MRERWVKDPGKGTRWRDFDLRAALGFPDIYRVGMANLGFLWVYHLLNSRQEVRCDRFFDADRQLKYGERLCAHETGRALSEYDVAAFSMPYEGGYQALPKMLILGGIEPVAAKRRGGPLVIAGGVAVSANPEPIADFIDIAVIGEAEPVLDPLIDLLIAAVSETRRGPAKRSRLDAIRPELRNLDGVYLPSDYRHVYGIGGALEAIEAADGAPARVTAARADLISVAAHSPIITDESVFPNRFLVEASRGCPYRCRFCLASHTSGNFREAGGLVETVAEGLAVTPKIGVIGTAFTRASNLKAICGLAAEAGGNVSFSSVRMDAGALKLLADIAPALDLESIAAAPEVATERLSRVIGKDALKDLDAFVAARPLPGLKRLRLYFLIGVPGEENTDVAAIADVAKEIRKRSGWEILCSVTPMIPKPFTPMQWAPFAAADVLRRRKELLKKELSGVKGVALKVESLRLSNEQAILARGDRRLGPVLLEAAEQMSRGGEKISLSQSLKSHGQEANQAARRERAENEALPWEILFHGVSRAHLYKEYKKAIEEARSKKT
ncbi:MAG: hypothetical protein WCX65_06640 [bacterium]